MKGILKTYFILTICLIFGGLMMTACTASQKTANDKGAAGEAGQIQSTASNSKLAENKSNEAKKSSEKEVLWDFRKNDDSKPPTFSKAETDAVVKYLFGNDAYPNLQISSRLSGSFTKPNAKETLYYISGCKDETSGKFVGDCPHVSWDTAAWIAVYDGTTPILKIEKALGSNLGKVTDVNGDGKNEFLSFAGYAQSGTQTQSVSIGQITDGKYESIKGFSGFAYNCEFSDDMPEDKKFVKAVFISYIPTADGKMPEFSEEYFQGKCKKGNSVTDSIDQSSWKKITKKEFDDFFYSLS